MVRIAAMAAVAVVAVSAAAAADTDADRARQWGLIGTWATDCAKPPTENAPYLIYVAAGDKVLHRRKYPKISDSNQVRSVELVDGGGIKLTVYFSDIDPPQTRIYEIYREGDKAHTKYNYGASDQSYTIKDFTIVANGQPVVWITKCR